MKLTPKEKAKELVEKYSVVDVKEAKIKASNEIDDIIYEYKLDEKSEYMYSFWKKVKQELKKL